MKNERGSALMIVMLIVFVTTTIGAALSSFIMMNYKLRTIDNKIGRAEYEAETQVDLAYLAVQQAVKNHIDDNFWDAWNEISDSKAAEKLEYEKLLKMAYDTYYNWYDCDYGKMVNGIYVDDEQKIETAINNSFAERYTDNSELLFDKIKTEIKKKLKIDVIEFDEDTLYSAPDNMKSINSDGTGIGMMNRSGDNLIFGFKIFYKIKGSPLIEFTVDFVIGMPTYDEAFADSYNLNELVGMTNWSMQDWGYL